MSFSDTIKGLIFKKSDVSDPRRSNEPMANGRRKNENENPFLSARRTWNDHISEVKSSRQTWQLIGILSLLIALTGVGGIIHIGSQSKYVPYIVEVDKLGQSVAVSPAQRANKDDIRIIKAKVAAFMADARTVTPDASLQRKSVFRVYSMLAPNDPATVKMNEWLNGDEDASPFKRAQKETVSIEIDTVIPQTPTTWQVDWVETVRDRQGIVKGKPFHMRALVTIYLVPPTSDTSEEQVFNNPIGIYVRDYSWSKQN